MKHAGKLTIIGFGAAAAIAGMAGAYSPPGQVYVDPGSSAYKAALKPDADKRVLNHLPYPTDIEAAGPTHVALTSIPGVDGSGNPRTCRLRPPVATAVQALIAQVNGAIPVTARKLYAYSCFRSIAEQKVVFCQASGTRCREPVDRAKSSAPSRYSEHATGYTLDFTTCVNTGTASAPRLACAPLTEGFSETLAGKKLAELAAGKGFELSFPCANRLATRCESKQGVTYEPWHWRWVGESASVAGAGDARALFARARKCFPAKPGVDSTPDPASIANCLRETA